MGRLQTAFIERIDSFADRTLDVAAAAKRRGCPPFVRDQMGRAGTSVGSNVAEADEALTVPEFRHRLGLALRELGETKYWLRMTGRREWVKPARLRLLQDEAQQLTRILTTIIMKSEPGKGSPDPPHSDPADS